MHLILYCFEIQQFSMMQICRQCYVAVLSGAVEFCAFPDVAKSTPRKTAPANAKHADVMSNVEALAKKLDDPPQAPTAMIWNRPEQKHTHTLMHTCCLM